jgi:glutamine amidotransferase
MKKVTIIDYGNGNANSIKIALAELGAASVYSSKAIDVANADCIIMPGIGHLGAAMTALRDRCLIESLEEAVMIHRKPILGICLGMQLMTKFSEEGQSPGLGWVQAKVRKMRPADRIQFKIPHIGWNTVKGESTSLLLKGIKTEDEPFYFCHAFATEAVAGVAVTATVQYDRPYVAMFEADNIFGVQFHPEKSQECGLMLMQNFISFAG